MKASNRRSPRTEASHSDLSTLCGQLDDWRKSQLGRPRLPAEVWEEAAARAGTVAIEPRTLPASSVRGHGSAHFQLLSLTSDSVKA